MAHDEEEESQMTPECPRCSSEDTAPIHQEPMWMRSDQSDPDRQEQAWFRCLTCRHKWKEE